MFKIKKKFLCLGWMLCKVKRKFFWIDFNIFLQTCFTKKEKQNRNKLIILQKKLEIRFLEVGTKGKKIQIYVDLSVAKSYKEELNKIEIKRLNFKFFWWGVKMKKCKRDRMSMTLFVNNFSPSMLM